MLWLLHFLLIYIYVAQWATGVLVGNPSLFSRRGPASVLSWASPQVLDGSLALRSSIRLSCALGIQLVLKKCCWRERPSD